jgi:RimJ/RimL family protein N-acetyltransferase
MRMSRGAHPIDRESSRYCVRVLTPADAEEYRAIRLGALQELPSVFGMTPDQEPALPEIKGRLAENSRHRYFGSLEEDRLVGVVRLSRYEAPNKKHRAYIGGLYVLPSHRSRGYGRALMEAALNAAAGDPSVRRINLSVVTTHHSAIALYQALGFVIYGIEKEAFSDGGQFHDECLMTYLVPHGGAPADLRTICCAAGQEHPSGVSPARKPNAL